MSKKLLSPELEDALKQIIEHLHQNPGKADMNGRKLHLECGRKYIRVWYAWTLLVVLPNGDAFEPREAKGRRLPDFSKPLGNVIDAVNRKSWKRTIRFVLNRYNTPESIRFGRAPESPTCERCSRTNNVKQTVLGLLCSYCRGADVRHMNSVRQLGGVPRTDSYILQSNEDYYKTA